MKIESNIPIPMRRTATSPIAETLLKMKIGDSIVLPKKDDSKWRCTARVQGVKITTRYISDNELRLWRVK